MSTAAHHGIVVTISPVRCAVLAMHGLEPYMPRGALARWVGTPAYGHIEVLLPYSVERSALEIAVGG